MPQPRILGLLVGNIHDHSSGAWVKYGQLFHELAQCSRLVDVVDIELRGLDRYRGLLASARPSKQRWREAFHKNLWAFKQRSKLARRAVAARTGEADVVLQHGAIFHAHRAGGPPVVIYTDFTYRLAQREDSWRNPFTSVTASEQWNDLEHEAYHQAALVLTRSDHARQSLLDDYAMDPERVITVGGGVNFDPLPAAAPLEPAPRVLFIGKDFERKGGDLLLEAFRRARAHVPNAELVVVTAREDIVGPGVRRIAPTYDRAAIGDLYRSSSVFAMPSRCETWGDVFLEAMAYGLPCVATTADAMPEIVQHGATGLLSAPENVEDLAEALTTLLANESLRQQMGALGRARVAQRFTWRHTARQIVGAIEQLEHAPA